MQRLLLLGTSLLAGCGSPVDLLTGGRMNGGPHAVSVEADSATQAAPMALAHCSHYRLAAQFDRELEAGVYRYRCIAKDAE